MSLSQRTPAHAGTTPHLWQEYNQTNNLSKKSRQIQSVPAPCFVVQHRRQIDKLTNVLAFQQQSVCTMSPQSTEWLLAQLSVRYSCRRELVSTGILKKYLFLSPRTIKKTRSQ
jgi:hypothetical protein